MENEKIIGDTTTEKRIHRPHKTHKKWACSKKLSVINAFKQGDKSLEDIAEACDCATTYIYKILREYDKEWASKMPKKKTPPIIQDILASTETHATLTEIAKKYGVSRQYVSKLKQDIQNGKY